ncbi:MAG: hypothetical protein WAS27_01260 [Candidatus Saccharimonadales bacterium]
MTLSTATDIATTKKHVMEVLGNCVCSVDHVRLLVNGELMNDQQPLQRVVLITLLERMSSSVQDVVTIQWELVPREHGGRFDISPYDKVVVEASFIMCNYKVQPAPLGKSQLFRTAHASVDGASCALRVTRAGVEYAYSPRQHAESVVKLTFNSQMRLLPKSLYNLF